MNYYNEFDPHAAAWLRGLIAEGLIPAGEVDERSISDVLPTDLLGYTQCHFFAGIGGWSLALRLAGWPDDQPVWTGSCPCQPFSSAGKGLGRKDPRHLWPTFRRLINRRRPPVVFGEQVASADGRRWLAGVCANLEAMGYAPAALDLCAAGIGAPHIRQRLWWVGERVGNTDSLENHTAVQGQQMPAEGRHVPLGHGGAGGADRAICPGTNDLGLGNSHDAGPQGYSRNGDDRNQSGRFREEQDGSARETGGTTGRMADSNQLHDDGAGSSSSDDRRELCEKTVLRDFWSDSRLILCRDGKRRRIPTESALFPLADGLPYKLARRGSVRPALLKGAGNAIVPELAAEFIRAFIEVNFSNNQ